MLQLLSHQLRMDGRLGGDGYGSRGPLGGRVRGDRPGPVRFVNGNGQTTTGTRFRAGPGHQRRLPGRSTPGRRRRRRYGRSTTPTPTPTLPQPSNRWCGVVVGHFHPERPELHFLVGRAAPSSWGEVLLLALGSGRHAHIRAFGVIFVVRRRGRRQRHGICRTEIHVVIVPVAVVLRMGSRRVMVMVIAMVVVVFVVTW